MNDDLLPACPKARAILAALDVLHKARIRTTLHFEWNAAPPAWIAITPNRGTAVRMADLLPHEIKAILESYFTMHSSGLSVELKAEQTPIRLGIPPTAGKEEVRLSVLAVLEHQRHTGHAELAISKAMRPYIR